MSYKKQPIENKFADNQVHRTPQTPEPSVLICQRAALSGGAEHITRLMCNMLEGACLYKIMCSCMHVVSFVTSSQDLLSEGESHVLSYDDNV